MNNKPVSRLWTSLCAMVTSFLLLACPAFAANPSTGDNNQVPLMTILLVVSGVLILLLILTSVFKKKGKK